MSGVGENMQDHPACLVATRLKANSGHQAYTDELYHVSRASWVVDARCLTLLTVAVEIE